ncbi:hypothetical protein [Arthrobacter cryoconiti]|uniref:Acetyltransferase n=1 Tax=Arthrobacter cryoconiti TaxID=748907 RepID=A0ABV8R118_9MICC|nr:hypothetical protein [Arthrobacter cryoconiti]MCC9068054.1 hypothetical protein [Arthrobacter cryoconiti]
MNLATFTFSGKDFGLRRATASDVEHIIELLANDPLRQTEGSAAPEQWAPYQAAFKATEPSLAEWGKALIYSRTSQDHASIKVLANHRLKDR